MSLIKNLITHAPSIFNIDGVPCEVGVEFSDFVTSGLGEKKARRVTVEFVHQKRENMTILGLGGLTTLHPGKAVKRLVISGGMDVVENTLQALLKDQL